MKGIILAAGASRRLMPLTANIPKSLIELNGKGLLERQLDTLVEAGITEAVIVVGYLKEMITGKFGHTYKSINIKYVENPDYAATNTIYSLYLALKAEEDIPEFIYFNADVLVHPDVVKRLVFSGYRSVLAVDKKKCAEEEVKFTTNVAGEITAISKEIDTTVAEGEFIGIGKFGSPFNAELFRQLGKAVDEGLVQSYFELGVERALAKEEIFVEDVSDLPCIEIDFPEDLEAAKKLVHLVDAGIGEGRAAGA